MRLCKRERRDAVDDVDDCNGPSARRPADARGTDPGCSRLEDRYAQTVSYTPRQPSSIEVRMRLIGFRQLTHTLSCRRDSIVPGPQEPSRALAHSNS